MGRKLHLISLIVYCYLHLVESVERCYDPDLIASCKITGYHIETFDGMKLEYSVCNQILARNKLSNKWSIEVRKSCLACNKVVHIQHKGRLISLYQSLGVVYLGHFYTAIQANFIGQELEEFSVHKNGDSVYFQSELYEFSVLFHKLGNIEIFVSGELSNKIEGACGKYNGREEDDPTMPSGQLMPISSIFGNSWKIPNTNLSCIAPTCRNRTAAIDMCRGMNHPLTLCSDVVDMDVCIESCVQHICDCLAAGKPTETCRCAALEEFKKTCQAKSNEFNWNYSQLDFWRAPNNCSTTTPICPTGMVYYECYRYKCDQTCYNKRAECRQKLNNGCYSGCFCRPGYALKKSDICVPLQECKPCTCTGMGDPHYVTFDGTRYDFQGNCTYVAARNKDRQNPNSFQVLVSNFQCGPGVTCTRQVIVLFKQNRIVLSWSNSKVFTNINDLVLDNYPYSVNWVRVEEADNAKVTVFIPDIELVVTFGGPAGFTIQTSQEIFYENFEGLCGNCNENQKDDLIVAGTGQLTSDINVFANSWLAVQTTENSASCRNTVTIPPVICPPLPSNQDQCLKILAPVFEKCHALVDPKPYIINCQFDRCHQEENKDQVACGALSAYAEACRRRGLCIDWRSNDLCPYSCPSDKVYSACGLGCEITCLNYAEYRRNPNGFCPLENREGCFCREGEVEIQGKCYPVSRCRDCSCMGYSDPLYITYDGTSLDYQGECTHVASRDVIRSGTSIRHTFQVLTTHRKCTPTGPNTCIFAVTILYDNHVIIINRVQSTSPNVNIMVDNVLVPNFAIRGSWYYIERQDMGSTPKVTIYIPNIELQVSYQAIWSYGGHFTINTKSIYDMEGLCGNCNGNRWDDYRLRNGSINSNVYTFGPNWIVPRNELPPGLPAETCPIAVPPPPCNTSTLPTAVVEACRAILNVTVFGSCHGKLDTNLLVQNCLMEACRAPPPSNRTEQFKCDFIQTYVHMCKTRGVCLEWRSPNLCPISCPRGLEYKSCSTECTKTCDDRWTNCTLQAQEGCFCPRGRVWDNDACIPEDLCPRCEECGVETIPPTNTVFLIRETLPGHGLCRNEEAIFGLTKCTGQCQSSLLYIDNNNQFAMNPACCLPRTYRNTTVSLTCADGFRYNKIVSAISACSCSQCNRCEYE